MGGDAWYNVTVKNDTQHFEERDYYISRAGTGIDFRAKNYDSIENLKENSIDFYEFMEQTLEHALYIRTKFYKIESGTEEWLDYERIAKIIKSANYNGCISVVYEGQHKDRVEQVRLGVKCLRDLLS